MPSSAFAAFQESYFGDAYMAWHDGLDEQSLLSLEGEERAEAERMLQAALGSGDYRPAAGLNTLRSHGSAPELKKLLPGSYGKAEVEIALALWELEQYPPAEEALIRVLLTTPDWPTRLDAAMALKKVRTEESVAALRAALDDPDALVRHHAAASLFDMYGVHPAGTGEDHQLTIEIMMEDEARRAEAKKAILTLVGAATPPWD